MSKPTLLQTILNRPSQSYTAKYPQGKQSSQSRQDLLHLAPELGHSGGVSQSSIPSVSTLYSYPSLDNNVGGAVLSPRSSPMKIQGSSAHVSSSHAPQAKSSSAVSTTTVPTPSYAPPPPIPTKDYFSSEPAPRLRRSRNNIPDLNSAQRAEPTAAYLTPGGATLKHSPNSEGQEDEDNEDNESTTDVFYTPNSTPRASFASSTAMAMSYGPAATITRRKVSQRNLQGNTGGLDRQPSHKSTHSIPKSDGRGSKQESSIPSTSKADPPSNNTLPTTKSSSPQITSTEPSPSRRTAVTQTSPSNSARVVVPSTRTPSRSNSLNHNRTTRTNSPGQVQNQSKPHGRAMVTTSIVSNTSSMSSNTLDGHSVVFSDLVTDTTRATTPLPDGNDVKNSPNKGYGSATTDATKRWVDKAASNPIKATTTPMNQHTSSSSGSTFQSQPRQRPVKSHTYNGLGIGLSTTPNNTNSSNTSAFANPTLYHQYQYQQYHRNRDNKSNVMMSMTAVLEAAEEEELYRHGKKKGGVGSSAWRARQLLRQHQHNGKTSVLEAGSSTGSRADTDSKGKGKEKADDNFVRGRLGGNDKNNGSRQDKGKGKERESPSATYIKHQPLTSSPLAISSKPLPTPESGSLPRNNGFLEVPAPSRPRLGHRRSRSLGAESKPMYERSESSYRTPGSATSLQQDIITPRTAGHPRAHYLNSHASSSTMTGTGDTVDLTALPQSSGDLPSKGTAGYTSLTLPRAPPPLNLDGNATRNGHGGFLSRNGEGKVDLTRDGLAQTTMASVEVVRGLGGTAGKKGLMGILQLPLVRRKTAPAKIGLAAGMETRVDNDEQMVGGVSGLTSVLGFTSHRKPPEYVPSGCVLVQVWAVGVDGVDGKLTGVRMMPGCASNGNGTSSTSLVAATSTKRDQDHRMRQEGRLTNEAGIVQEEGDQRDNPKPKGLGRSLSLRERITRSVSLGRSAGKDDLHQRRQVSGQSVDKLQLPEIRERYSPFGGAGTTMIPGIGHVPGRSFVGRVVECGWEVREELVRKGDWVAGLLDIKKSGALTEFVVVDRHRVHRVPQPQLSPANDRVLSALIFSPPTSSSSASSTLVHHSLTLEELALLPLCGLPAYRAVRTFIYAFSSMRDNPSISPVGRSPEGGKRRPVRHDPHKPIDFASYGTMISRLHLGDHEHGRRRRALVLRGHDGIGAMAVQMLVLRGWRVCVHVPFIASPPNLPTTHSIADGFMEEVEERIRKWGAEEVIFDDGEVVGMDEGRAAVVRVVNGLREDGDVFDVVLDTIGGKEVREAAERLLRSPARRANSDRSVNGGSRDDKAITRGMGQFTTIVGDNPERPIPSAGDLFRAGIRSLKFGSGGGGSSFTLNSAKSSSENLSGGTHDSKGGKVGYAWVNISQDVDWEGKDVGETIGSLVELALEYGIKPWVGAEYAKVNDGTGRNRRVLQSTEQPSSSVAENSTTPETEFHWEGKRIVPFERAPDVFISGGPLMSGGTVVVKIAT